MKFSHIRGLYKYTSFVLEDSFVVTVKYVQQKRLSNAGDKTWWRTLKHLINKLKYG